MIGTGIRAGRLVRGLVIGVGSLLLAIHGVGWIATAVVFIRTATLHVPTLQSAIAIALGVVVIRAGALGRRARRRIVLGVLALAFLAFMAAPPYPERFEGVGLMLSVDDIARGREGFEQRFGVGYGGPVNFHSHLSDVLIATLDHAFGRSDTSPLRAYDVASRVFGLIFILELAIVAACHRWSRQVCRYTGLALTAPLTLMFFGFREVGYFSMAAGAVPLLMLARGRTNAGSGAAALGAGALQGFHTAFHGFGMLGVGGGVLAGLSRPGRLVDRLIHTMAFASAAVALYLGWLFVYITVAGLKIDWNRSLGFRPLFEPMVFDNRVATTLFTLAGLGEFGLFSALSGVPILALAILTRRQGAVVPAILYGLPGLLYLVRWWPVSAPFNFDLLLSAFPGVFAACWAVAASRRRSLVALVTFACIHALLWTTVGNAMFARVWVDDLP